MCTGDRVPTGCGSTHQRIKRVWVCHYGQCWGCWSLHKISEPFNSWGTHHNCREGEFGITFNLLHYSPLFSWMKITWFVFKPSRQDKWWEMLVCWEQLTGCECSWPICIFLASLLKQEEFWVHDKWQTIMPDNAEAVSGIRRASANGIACLPWTLWSSREDTAFAAFNCAVL
jgi:hypothetical protein